MIKEAIQFPGWSVNWGKKPSQEMVMVAGGRLPSQKWLEDMAQGRIIWGVDRGTRLIIDASLMPAGITGDFDSLPHPYLEKMEKLERPVFRHPVDKDFTDLELALDKVLTGDPAPDGLWLTGVFGGRLDHTLANLRVLSKMSKSHSLLLGMIDEKEALLFVKGGERIDCVFDRIPNIISLLPLSEEITGAELSGCYWSLPKDRWSSCEMPPISNRLAVGSTSLSFSLGSGLAGIYCCWEEAGL